MKLERKLFAANETGTAYRRRGVRRVLFSVLPESFYDRLRAKRLQFEGSGSGRAFRLAGARYLSLIARSGVLSALHYAFFSREFDREHRAVLAARSRHIEDVFAGRGNLYMLRRNVHRLEKGLIMKPPRPIFGLDKIGETVTAYVNCLEQLRAGDENLRTSIEWSTAILKSYFGRVAEHPVIAEARARFEAAEASAGVPQTAERVPFLREQPANLPTIDQLEQLAAHRRSARWFDQRPVPREAIDRAVLIATQSPTACNRQPFRFEFFDRHDLVQKVGAVPKGTPGWLHQIPCFMVIIGKFEAFRFERDRHVPYIDGCLAAMSLINALEVQGISSCCVNFPDLPDTEVRMAQVLNLPPWERAIMCLAIGYPEAGERVPFSQKLPLEALRLYNHGGDV